MTEFERIIDTNKLITDKNKELLFFGEFSGFQRYDNPTYDFAVKLEERQRNAFWNPSEITLTTDAQKYWELPEEIQEVLVRVWLFQTLMDSGQNKGLEEVLAGLATNSELEAMFKTWGYFELIHSLSYSHLIRGIFPNSTEVFDRIDDYPEILKRIDTEIDLYSKVKTLETDDTLSLTEKKKIILELLVNVFALEGIKFYVAFLVTYIVNNAYNSKIPGATRIMKLINFDEDLHTSMGANLLSTLKREKKEGFSELINSEWFSEMTKKVFTKVYEDEMEFARYLLGIADIPTLTEAVLDSFIKYYVDLRLTQLQQEKIYNQEKTDVVSWFESYKNLNLDNSALQESDSAVYSVGILRDDLDSGVMNLDQMMKDLVKIA